MLFFFKKHPASIKESSSLKEYYALFENCIELANYVPVEVFITQIDNCVVSVCSISMLTASKFDNLNAISLLELVKWHNKETKEGWKTDLTKGSKNKILFPETFEELKEIMYA